METKETEFIYSERSSKKQPYDKRLIDHVMMLIRSDVPRRDIIEKYGVSANTLSDWVQRYGSGLGKVKRYTAAEKRSVVRAIASGMGVKQAQIAFNISSAGLIRRWMNDFKEENTELSSPNPLQVAKKTISQPDKTELEALRKALEEEVLKNRALNTMIDIAEQQLKVDIRKKSGARQSSK